MRVSNRPASQSDYLWALQNGCDMSSWLCWKHVHHVGEYGPGLSVHEWFAHAVTFQSRVDFGTAHYSRDVHISLRYFVESR